MVRLLQFVLAGLFFLPVTGPGQTQPRRYRIEELRIANDSNAWAHGISSTGTIVGEAETRTQRSPLLVHHRFQNRTLSYFDRDNGYTNREMIDLIGLAFLLARPQLIRDYYSAKRYEREERWFARQGGTPQLPLLAVEPFAAPDKRGKPLTGLLTVRDAGGEATPERIGIARAINRAGWIVGQGRVSPVEEREQALLWMPNKKRSVLLNGPDDNGEQSIAFSINDHGSVVGEAEVARNLRHAFLWEIREPDALPRRTDLGTLGGTQSSARAINDGGTIAGWSEDPQFVVRACLWQAGKPRPLESPADTPASFALAINRSCTAAGFALRAEQGSIPLLWEPAGRAVRLPCPAEGGKAYALNDAGEVVGSVGQEGTAAQRAVLWVQGQYFDLNRCLPTGNNWTLRAATGINDAGTICGWGVYQGKIRPFRLIPISSQ